MGRERSYSRVSWLTSLALAASLCAGLAAGGWSPARAGSRKQAGRGADRTGRDRISADLRQRLRDSKDERRRRDGDDGVARVIVQLAGKPTGQLNAFLNRNGVHVRAQFDQLNSLAVELPASALEELSSFDEVSYVSADREVNSLGGHLSVEVGAEMVRQQTSATGTAYNLDGTGVGIAVLDSGLDTSHKSFTGRVGGSKDYTGENRTDDPFGHGSHVAAIAAGSASILSGKYSGVAPNATIYNARVLNSQGKGTVSGVLAALDDVLTYHTTYNIRVVNMSLGMPAVDSYLDDPVCQAVRKLVDAGVVVVAAAGNNGKDDAGDKVYGLIHSPGNEPSAITVGAANDFGTIDRSNDGVTSYSSRGPTRSFWTDASGVRNYDNLVKPDLVAPGNKVGSAEAVNNSLVTANPTLDLGVSKFTNQKMMRLSGTSMATPVVAGAAALLFQLNPKLTPNMVKMILMYSAQQLAGFNTLEQGAGEVNVEGAVRLAKLMKVFPAGTAPGTPMLAGTAPDPHTTIKYTGDTGSAASTSFTWSQGVVLNHTYATGQEIITAYQAIYGLGVLYGDGVLLGDGVLYSDGVLYGDAAIYSSGVVFGDQLLTSSGVTISEGSPFLGAGVLYGDGVIFSDGVVFGDGVLLSDGVLYGDYATRGDCVSQSLPTLAGGDK